MSTKKQRLVAALNNAEDYLKGPGRWIKGEMRMPGGKVCLLGAVVTSGLSSKEFREARTALNTTATEMFSDRITTPEARWWLAPSARLNDHDDTTLDDVLAVLVKTRLKIEEEIEGEME